ncbi:MAG TPA: cytochrome c [Bacteroidia bacterium]|nr:cytochrome c [Bacteroidia bacterium]
MNSIILHTHIIVVTIFFLIYLIKTFLLLSNAKEKLASFIKKTKILEMVVSVLFLITGGILLVSLPQINTFMILKLVAIFASIPIAIIGYKKGNKLLATLAFLLIVAAYGLAEMSAKSPSVVASTSVDGKELYTNNCVKCHGTDGKAGVMGAADLSALQADNASIINTIKNGKNSMPAYGGNLSDAQIKALSDYVATLKK